MFRRLPFMKTFDIRLRCRRAIHSRDAILFECGSAKKLCHSMASSPDIPFASASAFSVFFFPIEWFQWRRHGCASRRNGEFFLSLLSNYWYSYYYCCEQFDRILHFSMEYGSIQLQWLTILVGIETKEEKNDSEARIGRLNEVSAITRKNIKASTCSLPWNVLAFFMFTVTHDSGQRHQWIKVPMNAYYYYAGGNSANEHVRARKLLHSSFIVVDNKTIRFDGMNIAICDHRKIDTHTSGPCLAR